MTIKLTLLSGKSMQLESPEVRYTLPAVEQNSVKLSATCASIGWLMPPTLALFVLFKRNSVGLAL